MKIKGFTLAEVMIVLVIIGILGAVLLPSMNKTKPDENIIKFKSANETLYRVIYELVSSGKYYLVGDLGIKPDGTLINGDHSGDYTYLCETIADVLKTKSVNCTEYYKPAAVSAGYSSDEKTRQQRTWVKDSVTFKNDMDEFCKQAATVASKDIITADGVVYYQGGSKFTFGINDYNAKHLQESTYCEDNNAVESCKQSRHMTAKSLEDNNGMQMMHKVFCIDVDGIPNNITESNCVNECPFGYGIRYDGKIITGARADEWLKKSVREKE